MPKSYMMLCRSLSCVQSRRRVSTAVCGVQSRSLSCMPKDSTDEMFKIETWYHNRTAGGVVVEHCTSLNPYKSTCAEK
jgi:hypothetical protein